MKIFRKTALVFIAIFIILAGAAFLLPEQVHIKRQVQINAPVRVVFAQVNDLQCWKKWVPWNRTDPAMKFKYTDGGVGKNAGYEWSSENHQAGNGELFITASEPYDSIDVSIDFAEGGLTSGYFLFSENGSKTDITWAFDMHLGKNPLARWAGLMFDQMIGRDLEKGLNTLDSLCMETVRRHEPVVELTSLPETVFAGIRKTVKWENIGDEMGNMYQEISSFLLKEKMEPAGMPFAIYHSMNKDKIEIECGVPVASPFEPEAGINCGKQHAGKYAFAVHTGSYETLEKTHSAIQRWISEHSFSLTGGPVEVYLTGPQNEPDQEKWKTNIYYPL